jgi:hypothetical protein
MTREDSREWWEVDSRESYARTRDPNYGAQGGDSEMRMVFEGKKDGSATVPTGLGGSAELALTREVLEIPKAHTEFEKGEREEKNRGDEICRCKKSTGEVQVEKRSDGPREDRDRLSWGLVRLFLHLQYNEEWKWNNIGLDWARLDWAVRHVGGICRLLS